MRNSDLWASYRSYTEELTKFARQLAFAGVAICWFFRSPNVTFPTPVLAALALLVGYFAADILQYFVAAMRLRSWTRNAEKRLWEQSGTIEGEYQLPESLDRPPFVFFVAKIALLLAAFSSLAVEFAHRMRAS